MSDATPGARPVLGIAAHAELREALGYDDIRYADGQAEIIWRPGKPWVNSAGGVFGGVIPALIDLATGIAVLNADVGIPEAAPTVSMHIDYLRPLSMGHVYRVISRPLRVGRRLAVAEATILDEQGTLLVRASATLAIVRADPRS